MRVLLIEDENVIANFILRGLREEGYSVSRAANGEDGWRLMTEGSWNLILLDWRLPSRDGVTLLREYRKRDSETPVLFLTARDAIADRVTGLDAGADDYLSKPFDFDELLARMRALMRRPARGTTALSYKDVTLDLAAHRTERAGRPIDLTLKEMTLLAYFLRHPEQVLTRAKIYEEVWNDKYDGTTNTLEVHISELRRKLEALGPRLIFTIRGQGYKFGPTKTNGRR